MPFLQALEAEGLKKELEGTQTSAAQVQAELSVQLEAQQSLSQDAQQQVEALRHEVEILQVRHMHMTSMHDLLQANRQMWVSWISP